MIPGAEEVSPIKYIFKMVKIWIVSMIIIYLTFYLSNFTQYEWFENERLSKENEENKEKSWTYNVNS